MSTFLKIELNRVERDKGFIRAVRGNGTFIGFDATSPQIAESLQRWLLRSGV
jgi:acetylornithine/succinyldiaminopimelate/putrescine aminotransferase